MEINAIMVATKPSIGMSDPTSHPKTIAEPIKPKIIPNHWLNETFSPKIGPLKIFVSTGCRVTINAAIAVGMPIDIEKKTPPK